MRRSGHVLEFLRTVDSPLADEALAAAIDHADAVDGEVLVDALLSRGRPEALLALIERYGALAPNLQRRIQVAGPPLLNALNVILRSGSSQIRVTALTILRSGGHLRHGHAAADALADRSAAVRKSAAETLRAMADLYFDSERQTIRTLLETMEPTPESHRMCAAVLARMTEERTSMVRSLQAAVEMFPTHHQLDVLEAAMYLADDLRDTLFGQAGGRRGRFSHAMLEVFARSVDPRLAGFAFHALAYPDLRAGVLNALAVRRDSAFFEAMIRLHAAAKIPGVRKALGMLHHLAWLESGIAPLMALPDDVHAAGLTFIASIGMPEDTLLDMLADVAEFESPAGHVQAAWLAIEHRSPGASRVLHALAECSTPDAARLARTELARRERPGVAVPLGANVEFAARWSNLLRSCRLEDRFDSFWDHPERIDLRNSGVTGAEIMSRIEGFATSLRERLCSGSVTDRIRACDLVTILGAEQAFEPEIFGLADEGDASLRGRVMVLLGRLSNATSRRILERAISDAEPRVRAAAVDSLAIVAGTRCCDKLLDLLYDESPTVRTAATRVLLQQRVPEAAQALLRSLCDPSAAHRLAALSLIGQLRLTALRPRVAEIGQNDPDEQVRQRSLRMLRLWASDAEAGEVALAGRGKT